MGTLFEKRERAAESLFAHDEETRFVTRRHGVEALAAWAGESMELEPADRITYAQRLVDAFVSGTPEDRLVTSVQMDLERAGKPSLSGQAGMVLAQAVAEARAAGSGHLHAASSPLDKNPREEWERHHPKPGHLWSL